MQFRTLKVYFSVTSLLFFPFCFIRHIPLSSRKPFLSEMARAVIQFILLDPSITFISTIKHIKPFSWWPCSGAMVPINTCKLSCLLSYQASNIFFIFLSMKALVNQLLSANSVSVFHMQIHINSWCYSYCSGESTCLLLWICVSYSSVRSCSIIAALSSTAIVITLMVDRIPLTFSTAISTFKNAYK